MKPTTEQTAPNWLEDYKDYLPHFRALHVPKDDVKNGCFYRACQAYCTEVLGVSLQSKKIHFDAIVKQYNGTPYFLAIPLLEECLVPFGFGVSKLRYLTNTKDTLIQHVARDFNKPFSIEALIETVHHTPEESTWEYPCIIEINRHILDKPFPANHWDAVIDSPALLDLVYNAIYISKVI